ncbi:MAG TPA: deoxyribonuclease IV [Bryobacteraceae bacterium]|nr:deoxyribonuclease IV [Bryobacteraceae bacterium]
MRIGIHTSIAGALENAALKAAEIGANTFQIFSSSPRTWRAASPDPDQIKRLKATRERLDLAPLVVHANYLINLAATDAGLRAQSVESFRGEIERAVAIGAEYLVLHPGSYGEQGMEKGICALVESLCAAEHGLKTNALAILIENTVGGGTKLGGNFEELRVIRELAGNFVKTRTGLCLDTAHLLASGYDIARPDGLRRTVREADAAFGIEHVKVIHANDSKTPLGSRCDRHTHIGEGHIGAEAFRRILNHPKLRTKPFILETPRDAEGDERRNVEKLKSLCRRRPTTISPSS